MRILLLTQIVPYPADSGPKIKTLNVLRHLAEHHDVHLVSFARSPAEVEAAEVLRRWCVTVDTVPLRRSRLLDLKTLAEAVVRRRSFLVERDASDLMRARIDQLLQQFSFDAVHADQLTMGQFAVDLPVPLRVLDEHNAVWTIVRRVAGQAGWWPWRIPVELEWRNLRRYEGALCREFDRVLVVSDGDRRDLEAAAKSGLRAEVVPITVDTDELPFSPPPDTARHILSVATMFYPPNIEGVNWFARHVFPTVRRNVAGTQFFIVGARPPAGIRQLGAHDTGIEVTGYVADLESYFRQCAMLAVPLHSGSGMRVKILEAFSRGIPVVATTIGIEGIDARHGEHLLVADTADDFALAVLAVLRDPTAARHRAVAARRLVDERYNRSHTLSALETIYPTTDGPKEAVGAGAATGAPGTSL